MYIWGFKFCVDAMPKNWLKGERGRKGDGSVGRARDF